MATQGEAYLISGTTRPADFTFYRYGQPVSRELMTAMAHIDASGVPVEVVQVRVYDRPNVTRIRTLDSGDVDPLYDIPIGALPQYTSPRTAILEDGREMVDVTRIGRFVRRDRLETYLRRGAPGNE